MSNRRSDSEAGARMRIKRIYRAARNSDGKRILVDRVWPRGMSKERARLDAWMKDVAPSDGLRKWFHAHADRWDEFRKRYFAELEENDGEVAALTELVRDGVVTLLYASVDEDRNNAVALRQYLLERGSDASASDPSDDASGTSLSECRYGKGAGLRWL